MGNVNVPFPPFQTFGPQLLAARARIGLAPVTYGAFPAVADPRQHCLRFLAGKALARREIIVNSTRSPSKPSGARARLSGVYRAEVLSSSDPLEQHRLRVRIPGLKISDIWALPCRSGPQAPLPAPEAIVWIAFEGGDSGLPVWLGVLA